MTRGGARLRRAALAGLAGVALGGGPARAQDPHAEVAGWLERFVQLPGVSGREEAVRDAVLAALPPGAHARVDERGNVLVTLGSGPPHALFVAHMDETGFVVEAIREDGCAVLRPRGGFWPSLYEAQPARVHTRRGPVHGVFPPRPDFTEATTRTPPGPPSVCFGTASRAETEALGVAVGDPVTMPKEFARLGPHRATGRGFDDRVGTVAQILALRRLAPRGPEYGTVTFAWVVEEEVGLRGARHLAETGLRPDRVYAIDTFVSSDAPLESRRYAYAPLGRGPVVRAVDHSNVAPPDEVRRVQDAARRAGLPLQVGTTGGGNDGAAFLPYGAVDVPVGWPLRYSHSPAEVVDLRDVEALARLVEELARRP